MLNSESTIPQVAEAVKLWRLKAFLSCGLLKRIWFNQLGETK